MKFSFLSRRPRQTLAALLILSAVGRRALHAADAAADASADAVEKLDAVTVSGTPAPDQYQLPQINQSATAAQMDDTINAVDVEDALKYEPSLFLRKRNDGDNQAVLATRTWGVNSSARSLVYADGVLLSALVANNNTIGAPRWGMVSPDEIERVDVLYGPFAAAYPGNSMGAVVEITTRMPDKFEATATQTESFQDFSLYDTKKSDYVVAQTGVTVGDRIGHWSFWIAGNYEDSHTQPLLLVTASSLPAGTTGGIIAFNKLGQPADVLGASGFNDSDYASGQIKLAYDFSSSIRATYSLGVWSNHTASTVQTYLLDASGLPTYGGVAGFASGNSSWVEEHTMQSLILKSSGQGDWDWQAIGTLYNFDKDTQKSASTAASDGLGLGAAGKVAILGGTGWETADLKAAWHPEGRNGGQELSFGAHFDEYQLVNPTYNTPNWQTGTTFSSLATEGNGNTATQALWIQDAWQIVPAWKLTAGGRFEDWRAFDGINVNGATTVIQPDQSSSNFSPKATLAWTPAPKWTVTASVGNAYRYPTAGELYQLVSTGSTYTSPNPDLLPEKVWSEELRTEYQLPQGTARVSFFEEDTTNALVSQYEPLVPGSSTEYQYIMNVGKIRNRGVEVYLDQNNVAVTGLELSGSVTYVDSRILEDSGTGQLAGTVGKKAPYVPMWRATLVATYRPTKTLAWTVAGRYSGQQYSTVDNIDTNPNAFGGFDEFFVLDTHANWTFLPHWSLSGGIDNLLNRKYFLYHPFPQRTTVAEVSCSF